MAAIEPAKREALSEDFNQFGKLLAFAFFFGIQDLHRDNVMLTAAGVQAIDVEQVFSDLLLPSQTHMLATHESVFASAGLNILTKAQLEELPDENARVLLDGFVAMSEFLFHERSEILRILAEHRPVFASIPIRIFFRRTKDYVEYLAGSLHLDDLFAEEIEQLERKDVPFFFSRLSDPRASFYSTQDWHERIVNIPPGMDKMVSYTVKPPEEIFAEAAFKNRWARGLLYLCKKMPQLDRLQWPLCSVKRDGSQLLFRGPGISVKAKF